MSWSKARRKENGKYEFSIKGPMTKRQLDITMAMAECIVSSPFTSEEEKLKSLDELGSRTGTFSPDKRL